MGRQKGRWAKVETGFMLHDSRLNMCSPTTQLFYLKLWCYCVDQGAEDLSPAVCTPRMLQHITGLHPHTTRKAILELTGQDVTRVRQASDSGQTRGRLASDTRQTRGRHEADSDQRLVRLRSDGGLSVCGVTKLHPKTVTQSAPAGQDNVNVIVNDNDGREEDVVPEVHEETTSPSVASPRGNNLPWAHLLPWFAEHLHWFSQIPDWGDLASKICVECIDHRGIPWPALQEKLLASSDFLKSPAEWPAGKSYKPSRARSYYWNQVERYKYTAEDPEPKRRQPVGYSAAEDWPEGQTVKIDGQQPQKLPDKLPELK